MTQTRFLEAPLLRQAEGELKNVSLLSFDIDRYSVFQLDFAEGFRNQI